ncbi:CLUMA_CG020355, isoform A [Clunio marinus]|uniref:CLUMA_CG020355, isoform A n=1 Tax=Clunio marinus TaxID=568069 RepID=A0A1J1J5V7_9DIPT|nr:CLUMA_CG020355, isoform A [Clunio marinus]
MTSKQVNDRSFKRSIDGIFTVFSNLKNQKSVEVEKFQSAFYNVAVIIICGAFILVILVLLPFLKPLLWASLVGAALFPAKKKISNAIYNWLSLIEETEMPIAFGLFMLPFNGFDKLGEIIACWLMTHMKILLILIGSLTMLQIIYYYVPSIVFSAAASSIIWLHTFLGNMIGSLSLTLVLSLLFCYGISVVLLWNESRSKLFTIIGQGIWVLIVAYVCSFLGAVQIPAFAAVVIYGLAGLLTDEESVDDSTLIKKIKKTFQKSSSDHEQETNLEKMSDDQKFPNTPIGRFLTTKSHLSEIKHKMQLSLQHDDEETNKENDQKDELESDSYFKLLFYAVIVTLLWHQLWIIFIAFILVSWKLFKELINILGLKKYLEEQWKNNYLERINNWYSPRRFALLPVCLPGVLQLNAKLHKFFCSKLKSYADDIGAIVVIVVLIVSVIMLTVFFCLQIYSETITVATLGSNLVNRTLSTRPELLEMLPIDMQSMNDVIDNAYKYSRGTIEDYLDNFFNGTNPEQAVKLKHQILSVWDRLIQSYMDRNNDSVGPRVPTESVFSSIDEIVTTSGVTVTGLVAWAKTNIDVLLEVSESLWIVLKANLSLLFSTITSLLSVLLGSGQTMIKFIFDTIIFFTTLYYLLQSSQERYAPIAMNINTTWGRRIADALEDSVSSVLVATLKLSVFHGLFTWLTHTVFGAHVVYLPSILASALAAAPFLESYWCCIPAFLDLWLSQDRFYLGLILVIIHFIIPSNFNPIIHSEIKGAHHPYLTALSIIGGLYLLGIEGAIIGPLLLCLLVVLSSITASSISSPTNTFTRQSSNDETQKISSPQLEFSMRTPMRTIEAGTSLDNTL